MLQAAAWWLAVPAILAAAAVWIGADGAGLPPLDRRGLELAAAWRGPVLDAAFRGLTWLGSLSVLLPTVSAAAILLWRRDSPAEAGFLALALVGAAALAHLAKDLFARTRPEAVPGLSPMVSSLSFPSAHALQITAVALAVFVLAARRGWRRSAAVGWLLALVVVVVGLSRIYLQVHYPSDVLAGMLVAACWVLGLRAAMFAAGPARQG
ncbi:MAG: phosphatase PAP2 family protein [Pseudomonadota bacterium]